MFSRRTSKRRYNSEQITGWLSFLACTLTRNNQAIFYLETLDYDSLPTRLQRCCARVALPVLFWMLSFGSPWGLVIGLYGVFGNLRPVETIWLRWVWTSFKANYELNLEFLKVASEQKFYKLDFLF